MSILREIFETLREYYEKREPMPWWPEDPLEVIVGAVLVQGSTWKSVDRVLKTLRDENRLDFRRMLDCTDEGLAALIRPVGFQTKKVGRLKALCRLFLERSEGQIPQFFARDADEARRDLMAVQGIGPGTADNILLYAGKIPIYMVDPFTQRILLRHGIIASQDREPDIQRLIHQELTPDEEPYGAKLFHDFQAYIVRLGRDFCDRSKPRCTQCPLAPFLPESGPQGLAESGKPASVAPLKARTTKFAPMPEFEPTSKEIDTPPPEFDNETERILYEQLADGPMPIDLLIQKTGLPVHLVRATIAILEMRKIVKQIEGNQVRRV